MAIAAVIVIVMVLGVGLTIYLIILILAPPIEEETGNPSEKTPVVPKPRPQKIEKSVFDTLPISI